MGKVTYRGADEIRKFFQGSVQFKEEEILSHIPSKYHEILKADLEDYGLIFFAWGQDSRKEELTVEYIDER